MKKTIISLLILLLFSRIGFSQTDSIWINRYNQISADLRSLESTIPGLDEKVNTSISGVSLNEFLRAIAKSSGINLSVDPKLSAQIINNFNDVKVIDVFLYLCQQYKLDISAIGNIIVVRQPEQEPIPPVCRIEYDSLNNSLSIEAEDEELSSLARKITEITGQNIIPAPGLSGQKVRGYIQKMPLAGALDKLAYSNNLILKNTEDGYYLLEKKIPEKTEGLNSAVSLPKQEKDGTFKLASRLLGEDSLFLYAEKAPIGEVIKEISAKTGNNYVMASVPKGEVSLQVNGASYQEILRAVLSGSDNVFKKLDKIYVIGNKNLADLMNQRIVQLQYRAVDSIQSYIPKDLINEIETRIFREQNSIMLSGPVDKVADVERFIQQIDKLVPVISIEVLIIDYNTSYNISSGITAGVGTSTITTSGEVFPSIDINLNSQSINDLISRFNGFGWAKIGKVTPNFYASLKAMESQGILNIRSTPILSTLNGHQTELSIGKTEYYMEEQVNIIGTQNPQTSTSKIYKSVNADLSVIITPVVSGDDQITLKVEVNQSDFTARLSTTAPPGMVTRTFKSQIRVKNEEMILLGGLEEDNHSKTSEGVPFLSRVPVLKWIFSRRNEEKSKSKLNIFIKPTIIS